MAKKQIKMNKIEKLIEELCPQGVEFRALGEVLQRTKGTPITAKQMNEINKKGVPIKIFAGGKTVAYVDYGDIPKKDVLTTESVVVKSRGIIGFEYINKPFSHKNEFWSYHSNNPEISIKYIFYYLKNKEYYFQSVGKRMSKMPQLSIPDTDKFQIPIPPLPIQKEIVKILDTFIRLVAELGAELEARKKQYEHYREELLSFGDDVEWKALGEVFNIKNGYTPSKAKSEYWTNGTIPWFRMEDIRENGRVLNNSIQHITPEAVKGSSLFPKNSIIIATSATIGEHALITVPFLSNQRFTSLSLKSDINNHLDIKFVFYYSFILAEWCCNNTTTSSFASVDMNGFKKFQIPIPPLSKQKEIVAILDKFDALVNDISTGLPAEITARKKQYEYYRNQLLTFKLMEAQDVN